MGAEHSHGPTTPSSPGAVRATLAVLIPLALATLVALVWLWPDDRDPGPAKSGAQQQHVTGTIISVTFKQCPVVGAPEGDTPPGAEGSGDGKPKGRTPARCGDAKVELTSGAQSGQVVTTELPSGPGSSRYGPGDEIVLIAMAGDAGAGTYQISDHERSVPLWIVGAAFIITVIAFGRLRGLTALIGLGITFALLLTFLIPAILAGSPPLLVAIVCAAAIILVVLFLTHGFTVPTAIAVVGTMLCLALTGLLATAAIDLTHLSGITDDSSLYLDIDYNINTKGLLLASIIIGSLGVLDDVTVTQAVTVTELARANPSYGFFQLYRAATRVGRAHIASVINTIILAYAGASLPLLLMFNIGNMPLGQALTSPVLAQEIVRAVAGTLGLIAAVPITTALAALAGSRRSADVSDATPDDIPASAPSPTATRARAMALYEDPDEPMWPAPTSSPPPPDSAT
ncbi:YibE/F family protein [Actinomadura sp. 6N118]|uniref:YibE/F family protein n=1 Tax=Actinomadura sp. 6N118 TaxID=3375151 RepID=UPI0037B445A5